MLADVEIRPELIQLMSVLLFSLSELVNVVAQSAEDTINTIR